MSINRKHLLLERFKSSELTLDTTLLVFWYDFAASLSHFLTVFGGQTCVMCDLRVKALDSVIKGLLAKGVDPENMVIVTFAGKERSQVLARDSFGGLELRKFTGRFDKAGNPIWTSGRIVAETLYRFKGQAAPYVILCEVDFAEWNDKQRRKLFVGMTRAQVH